MLIKWLRASFLSFTTITLGHTLNTQKRKILGACAYFCMGEVVHASISIMLDDDDENVHVVHQ